MSVKDVKLDVLKIKNLFKTYLNPDRLHCIKLIGFCKIKIERAEVMHYVDGTVSRSSTSSSISVR